MNRKIPAFDVACFMVGHRFVNEVQTMAQVFFPHVRIKLREELDLVQVEEPGVGISVFTWLDDAAHARVYIDGVEVACHSVLLDGAGVVSVGLPPRRVLMLAMFHALQGVFPVDAPWGALTGIRPSKMVRGWLDEGKSDAAIRSVLTDVLCVREEKARLALEVAHAERRLAARIFTGARAGVAKVSARVPVGVYVGIPFCPSRCAYCSFNMAHKPPERELLVRYVDVLLRECREKAREIRQLNGAVTSVYIGGGTPTVLPDDLLEKLLETVALHFLPIEINAAETPCEYTVEAGRPDTLTPANLRLMRVYAVNRIAVNPQTLNDRTLAAIGRNHTAADFFRAFALTREAGFPCINTDLIAHLPGETEADLMRSIEGLLPLMPENITIHTLSVKRASRLREETNRVILRVDYTPPNYCYQYAISIAAPLARTGYAPYYLYRQKNTVNLLENIGYSLPNHECLYNIGMMAEVQTILGIGAGAVTKYVEGDKITRVFNEKNPEIYMQRRL